MRITQERKKARGTPCLTVYCDQGALSLNVLSRESGYRVGEVSSSIGCSERYLRMLFIRDVGLTPKAWMRQERIRLACSLLRQGVSPIETGAELGFATANNFRREFQAVCGESPADYIKSQARINNVA